MLPWIMRSFALLLACAPVALFAQAPANHDLGYTETPMLPGQQYRVHDVKRPHPRVVTPPAQPGGAPSDAIVLFDGKDLSHWTKGHSHISGMKPFAGNEAPGWKLENGYMEVVPGQGDVASKETFGDCQLHVEFATPADAAGVSQGRGNSGVFMMGRYELEVLDSYNNPTYADGEAGAVYGQWPPLVNASRRPGEWQTFDIFFEAPHFEGDKLTKPAYVTIVYNGVVVQNHREIQSPTKHAALDQYAPQPAEDVIVLQNHNNRVRFRNIWARRL